MSKPRSVGAVVGQGTIGGALVSQAVLDDGIQQQFQSGSDEELKYGNVFLAPALFQDDVLHGVEGMNQTRKTNIKMNFMLKKIALNLNSTKSVCMMIGTHIQKKQFTKEINEKPLM